MKTRCPNCLTIFRLTSEQLIAREGKVRCGHCQTVFNAFDSLLDDDSLHAAASPPLPQLLLAPPRSGASTPTPTPDAPESPSRAGKVPKETPERPSSENDEISYGEWADEQIAPPLVLSTEKPLRWTFALFVGALVLAGQMLFHFRVELAIAVPRLRPAIERLSLAIKDPLPLPRNADFISIEASDLQSDPARDNLLILNATLRNKASYGQAYPSLELSLTNVQDAVIARRAFTPNEYLPKTPSVFSGNSDTAVHLWIEASNINAMGYRLFVFYP